MNRRRLLATGGVALCTPLVGGCLQQRDDGATNGENSESSDEDEETDDENGEPGVEDRVRACEQEYIQDEVVTRTDETISDPLQPVVVDAESRDDGEFLELRTEFGVTRRGGDNEPDEHLDYEVTAYYFVTADAVYRTDGAEAEGDPRDGVVLEC